ncbi:MAG: hypothetical protein ACLQVG_17590 [Terriglobia bacterium]
MRRKSLNNAATPGLGFDLHAMDALHIAAALSVGAEEFITSERSEKPINNLTALTVRTIHPLNQ